MKPVLHPTQSSLPQGYMLAPFSTPSPGAFQMCVVARSSGEERLVHLRENQYGHVYLGCIADQNHRPLCWLEIWVQDAGNSATTTAGHVPLNNFEADTAWIAHFSALRAAAPDDVFAVGWEIENPPPSVLDLARGRVEELRAPDGESLRLCKDDSNLSRASLPCYNTTAARFLQSDSSKFFPANRLAADASEKDILPFDTARHASFNLSAGHIMARRLAPVSYAELLDVLAGTPWKGLSAAHPQLALSPALASLADETAVASGAGLLMRQRWGRSSKLLEAFHLRVRLFLEALRSAALFTAASQTPFLNLSADSFGIVLPDHIADLPSLWSARCVITRPGDARLISSDESSAIFGKAKNSLQPDEYQPPGLHRKSSGSGEIRFFKTRQLDNGAYAAEATLSMSDHAGSAGPTDVVRARIYVNGAILELHGRVDEKAAAFSRQIGICFDQISLSQTETEIFLQAARALRHECNYAIFPRLNAPCDLYSLGVLAARTFLCGAQFPQEALNLIFDLTRELARQESKSPLEDRIGAIISAEPKLAEAFSSAQVFGLRTPAGECADLIPPQIWHALLAAIVRMFPGELGEESHCRNLGDAPPHALERIYDPALQAWEGISEQSKSLLFGDWALNREIASALARALNDGSLET